MFKFLRKNAEFMTLVSGFACTSVIGVAVGAKIFFQSKYRKIIQCKDKDGNDLEIDKDLNQLIEKVLNRIQLDPKCEVNLKFFISSLADPVYFGSLQLVLNSYVGLPKSFMYKTRADVDNVLIGGCDLNLTPLDASSFVDTLFLSDKAKAFAIARQIFYTNSYHLHTDLMLKSFALIGTLFTAHYTQIFFQLNKRLRPWARIFLYSLIGGVFYTMHLFLNDAYSNILDLRTDRKAAGLTLAYAEGGVEYYSKVIRRNKMAHDLTATGAYLYTATGNEKMGTVRRKRANLSTRLNVVKDQLDRMKKKVEEEQNSVQQQQNSEQETNSRGVGVPS